MDPKEGITERERTSPGTDKPKSAGFVRSSCSADNRCGRCDPDALLPVALSEVKASALSPSGEAAIARR